MIVGKSFRDLAITSASVRVGRAKIFLAYPQWNEDATCDKWRTGLQGGRRYRGEWRSMELQRTEWIDAPDIYVQNTVALEVSYRF